MENHKDKKELEKRANDYPERHMFWTQLSMSQFGYSVNLFTTIGIGFLGYLFKYFIDHPWEKSGFHLFAIIIVFCSVICGILSILYRLYDTRFTRHLLSITRRASLKYPEVSDSIEGLLEKREDPDLIKINFLQVFFRTLICKIPFIKETDFEDSMELKKKFENIRELSVLLAIKSWRLHKLQMLLLFAVIIYSLVALLLK